MVRIDRLSYAFGTNWALKDISLSLDKGGFLFLTGPSGAGKSTLLRLLHGSLSARRCTRAEVAGFDLKKLRPSQIPMLRRQVSVVFQDFKILPERTVFDNVALALHVRGMARHLVERRVRAVLRVLRLENKSYEKCGRLAGGEQQRVAIARSVVVNPQLILADEPTGNLDPGLSRRLMQVFKQFHTFGTSIIMATHNYDMIDLIPGAKVMHLCDGRMEASRCSDPVPAPDAAPDIRPEDTEYDPAHTGGDA